MKSNADHPLNTLADLHRWVLWKYLPAKVEGKPAQKIPYRVNGSGKPERASCSNPATWMTQDKAASHATDFSGMGITLGQVPDGLVLAGLDLDECFDDSGELLPWAAEIVAEFDTYAETSPSGRGIKLLFWLPETHASFTIDHGEAPAGSAHARRGVEFYSRGRYFTLTWKTYGETRPIRECKDALLALAPAKSVPRVDRGNGQDRLPGGEEFDAERLRSALEHVDADVYDLWIRTGMSLHSSGHELAFDLWDEWSRKSEKYPGSDELRKRWATFGKGNAQGGAVTLATIYRAAVDAGWEPPPKAQREPWEPPQWIDAESRDAAPGGGNGADSERDAQLGDIAAIAETLAPAFKGEPWPEPQDIFLPMAGPPPPTGIFAPVLEAYAADMSGRMGADLGMVTMSLFAACVTAITEEIKAKPKQHDEWSEPSRGWFAMVGPPSIKKSPVELAAFAPIIEIEAKESRGRGRLRAEYVGAMKQYAKALEDNAKNEIYNKPIKKLHAPERPRIDCPVVRDTTLEALEGLLQYTPRGTTWLPKELTGFIGGIDRYAGEQAVTTAGAYLTLYDGGPWSSSRVGRGDTSVANWAASIYGGIQPAEYRKFAKNASGNGMLQRFTPIAPRVCGMGHDDPPGGPHRDAYFELVYSLYYLPAGASVVAFEIGAREWFTKLCDFAHGMELDENYPAGLRTHFGKWAGQFVRYALAIQLIDAAVRAPEKVPPTITEEVAERTYRLFMEFLLPHALVTYLDILGDGTNGENARRIAGYILAHYEPSDKLQRISFSKIKASVHMMREATAEQVARVMDYLTTMGWADAGTIRQGGHRVPTTWAINPSVFPMFAEKAAEERERRARNQAAMLSAMGASSEKFTKS